MNILIVCGPRVSLREPYNGGTEASVTNLANTLVRLGHNVDVLAKDADEHNLFQVIEFDESPLSMRDDLQSEWRGQEMYQTYQYGLMNVDKYDVIHYNSYVEGIYDMGSFHTKPSLISFRLPLSEKFIAMYKSFIDRTNCQPVSISKRIEADWTAVVKRNSIYIPNGIDFEKWKSDVEHPKRNHFLWYGRITEEKNLLDAITVASELDQPLLIAGRIIDTDYFNKQVRPLLNDKIRYVGHLSQKEIVKLSSDCHAILATARWNEPFGYTNVEALAMGLKVIGYTTAVPEEFSDFKSVYRDKHNDIRTLTDLAKQSLSEEYTYEKEKLALFNLTEMAKSYQAAYKRVIASW